MVWHRTGLIAPWIQFFRMIPPRAINPLAIITRGIDEAPKIFVIFLAAFLSSVVATYQRVIGVDRTLINAVRILGAGNRVIVARVVVPASLPFILVGCRIGLGSAWATLVAAELIAAQSGLGFRMQQGQLFYDMPTIFVSLIHRRSGAADGLHRAMGGNPSDQLAGAAMSADIHFKDVSVLFITHDVDEAVYLANRVVVMGARSGRLPVVIEVDLPHPRTEEIRLSLTLPPSATVSRTPSITNPARPEQPEDPTGEEP